MSTITPTDALTALRLHFLAEQQRAEDQQRKLTKAQCEINRLTEENADLRNDLAAYQGKSMCLERENRGLLREMKGGRR